MKKIFKTTLPFIAAALLFTAVSSCQEDVMPQIDEPDGIVFDVPDTGSEVDPDDKDEGVKPR